MVYFGHMVIIDGSFRYAASILHKGSSICLLLRNALLFSDDIVVFDELGAKSLLSGKRSATNLGHPVEKSMELNLNKE